MKSNVNYKTLEEVCIKITDGAHWSPKSQEKGYPMASVKDMDENGFNFKNIKYISEEDYEKLVKSDSKPLLDDVLIAKDGSFLKHVFVCSNEIEMGILSSIAIIRPDKGCITPSYLRYVLKSKYMKSIMANFVTGSALQRIILSDFKKVKIPIPSIEEQIKFENVLVNYDELIETNNKRINLLEKMAQKIYKEWFVRMRFPGHEKAQFSKGIPKGWQYAQLKSFGKIVTGKTPRTSIEENFGGNIPFIKTPDMHGNLFVLNIAVTLTELGANTQKGCWIPVNSICVNCIGAKSGSVSITSQQSQTNQQINSIILRRPYDLEFLYFATKDLKQTIELFGATGATMTNLSKGKFEKLKVLYAEKNTVLIFNSVVNPIFEEIKALAKTNINLTKTRNLLLPRLISGKLLVK